MPPTVLSPFTFPASLCCQASTLKILPQEIPAYTDKAGGCVYPCRRQRSWAGKDQAPLSPAGTSVGCWDSVCVGRGNCLLSVERHGQSFKANRPLEIPITMSLFTCPCSKWGQLKLVIGKLGIKYSSFTRVCQQINHLSIVIQVQWISKIELSAFDTIQF